MFCILMKNMGDQIQALAIPFNMQSNSILLWRNLTLRSIRVLPLGLASTAAATRAAAAHIMIASGAGAACALREASAIGPGVVGSGPGGDQWPCAPESAGRHLSQVPGSSRAWLSSGLGRIWTQIGIVCVCVCVCVQRKK